MGQWEQAKTLTRSALGLWVVTGSSGKERSVGVSRMRGTPLFTVANWRKNHVISVTTFTDDLDIGESFEAWLKLLQSSGVPSAGWKFNCWS